MLPVSLQAAVAPRKCTSILSASPALSTSLATSRQQPVRCSVLQTPTTSSRLLKPAPLTAVAVCGLHRLLIRAVAVSHLPTFLLKGGGVEKVTLNLVVATVLVADRRVNIYMTESIYLLDNACSFYCKFST
jgi:hypothetical protein